MDAVALTRMIHHSVHTLCCEEKRLFGNNPRCEHWCWQTLTITWLSCVWFYLTRKSFAVAKVEMDEGTPIGLTTLQMSWIGGSHLTAYAISHFVWGFAATSWTRAGYFWRECGLRSRRRWPWGGGAGDAKEKAYEEEG